MSLKDELSLTHTIALFSNQQFLSFHSVFLSMSHTLSLPLFGNTLVLCLASHSVHLITFTAFCSFFLSSRHLRLSLLMETPPMSWSHEAAKNPRNPCWGTTGVLASRPKVPVLIYSHFRKQEQDISWESQKKKSS